MKSNNEEIAIVDIGSNSVRLFIFSIRDDKAEQITAMKFFCGLGKDLGTTGFLNPDAVNLTQEALAKFRQEIAKYSITHEIVIGTAALREAKDAADFLQSAKERSGFDIRVISGEEEARLAALAILSSHRHAYGIVADFGGGSLELAKVGEGQILSKVSLKLGAHYLSVTESGKNLIDAQLNDVLNKMPEFFQPANLYIIGGSWRSLAKAYLKDRGENSSDIDDRSLDVQKIKDFCLIIGKKEPVELIEAYSMEAPRAQLMDVSALMLEKIIAILQPAQVKVSKAGIRDGLVYDYILSRRH